MNKAEQLARLLPDGIDAALIHSKHNRFYLTGFTSSAGAVLVTRTDAYFLTDFRYIEAAQRRIRGITCLEYAELSESLSALVSDHGLHRIAVEDEGLSCAALQRYREMLTQAELTGGVLDGLLNRLRLVKTAKEIGYIREAQRITDEGFSYILSRIEAGRTEREIALELEFYMRSHGAEAISFDFIVVSGVNSSLPHGEPSDKAIAHGDFLTMDFGALVNGWHSDMTRTVAVGSCSDEQRLIYDVVLKAQLASLATLKAGVSCVQGDAAARDIIEQAGYGAHFGHGTGHGVGIEIHEAPRLSTRAGDTLLQAGYVVTVEPGIYLPGKFGVRIEDMVVITENGCDNLTKSPKDLIIV